MPGQLGTGLGLGAGHLFSGSCPLSPTPAPSFSTGHVATRVWPSDTDPGLSPCSVVPLPDCEGLRALGRPARSTWWLSLCPVRRLPPRQWSDGGSRAGSLGGRGPSHCQGCPREAWVAGCVGWESCCPLKGSGPGQVGSPPSSDRCWAPKKWIQPLASTPAPLAKAWPSGPPLPHPRTPGSSRRGPSWALTGSEDCQKRGGGTGVPVHSATC